MATNEKLKANEKFCMSHDEAVEYFGIGKNLLEEIINNHKDADWVLHIKSRTKIIRPLFEKWICEHRYF